jgi:hypothetical protein
MQCWIVILERTRSAQVGTTLVAIAREVGGIVDDDRRRCCARSCRRGWTAASWWKNLHKMGNRSVPIVALTAFFAGALMLVQSAPFVKKLGRHVPRRLGRRLRRAARDRPDPDRADVLGPGRRQQHRRARHDDRHRAARRPARARDRSGALPDRAARASR